MCKNIERPVTEALSRLEFEGCREVRRIYDSRNRDDLTGLFTVNTIGEGNFWNVDNDGDIHITSPYIRCANRIGNKRVARLWGDEYARVEVAYR